MCVLVCMLVYELVYKLLLAWNTCICIGMECVFTVPQKQYYNAASLLYAILKQKQKRWHGIKGLSNEVLDSVNIITLDYIA